MDVLNAKRPNPKLWFIELKILLVPSSWECIATQKPWEVFFLGHQGKSSHTLEDDQCWLALVNATGMI